MLRAITIALMLLAGEVAMAQKTQLQIEPLLDVAELIPEQVEVSGTSQGMAIWRNYAFLLHDKGQCVVVDLRREEFVSTFMMEGNTGHCNNASFGVERYSKESKFPLLYVSECRGERACYVNDISTEGSRLVQKIFYDGEEIVGPCDWCVDRANNQIYLYCTIGTMRIFKRFRLPRLADSDSRGEVHLRPEDALGSVVLGDIKIPQGSLVAGRYAYLPEGVPSRDRRLHIVDLISGEKVGIYDLNHIAIEPEGVAARRGKLYLSFHTPREPRHNVIYTFSITH